ncbi:GNAT family N-acetyltransferase [Mesobacillus subterraneus]|uniref:GNAT family N-acetyltransferase n=1 Tax=Mesobacillus subterraneus TaxID=285983 RepID=A0A427TQS1_9BACI|nr:GNAT family N-acetyltransferase [Mesobacillus subterraneus]RSD26646.1 GNAT family N-acetyltransferase [Mesobacillus subterraneus]
MAEEKIVRATEEDLPVIGEMFADCKEYLESRGILQWDEKYPNHEYFENAMQGEELFVLKKGEATIGVMVLDEWQTPEWEAAQWTETDGKPLILHSFCVDPSAQGGGYGSRMLQFAEDFAKENGYSALCLDTYSGNESAVRFYKKRDYDITGEVIMKGKPEGHELYVCFEKLF